LLLCGDADVQASRRAQVFASNVMYASFASAVTELLAVSYEEVNGVLRARLAVGNSVLTKQACCLNEQLARLCSLRRLR